MKKNNICTKTISGIVALTASLVLTFASCSNGMNLKDGLENSSDGKTYIKINAVSGMERTLSPKSDGLVEKLTSLKLKGTPRIVIADDAPVTEPEEVELAKADSFEELSKMAIPVEEGYWSFVLTADLEGVTFSGESSAQIKKGNVNTVTIKMSPETQYGGMSITVEFTGEADKVKATLYNEEGTEDLNTQTFNSSNFKNLGENKHSVTYTRRAADEQLAPGSYRLLFEFYENEDERVEYPLNSVENIVRVTAGINTSAVIKLDLNELYSITYETAGGRLASADDILTNKYSRKNGVALPTMKKEGYAFAGWFDNAGFEGNPITEIDEGSTGNKTLYAGFTNSVTVAANGNGATCNGMTGAFNSIETALMKINEWGDPSVDYTIYIDGTVTGSQVIKDTTDTIAAKSITLCGKNGLDDDKPQDVLDGNNDDPDVYGPVLTILTTVQVNINNLTISNGSSGILAGDDSANDQKVNVNVNLLEGCLITGNGSSSGVQIAAGQVTLDGGIISGNTREHGAGVYLYGGEFIMESGSIHDNSADYRGAGVYVANGTFTMNGGEIYSNTSENQLDGGGVYVENGTFTMNDGEIYSNTSDNQLNGGGVYVGWNEDSDNPLIGKFIMNGGTIHDHDAALGGGVYIDGLDLPETFTGTVSFVMKGGTISGNSSEGDANGGIGGGGVLVYGKNASFTMKDGTITGNTSGGYGGGVCVYDDASFVMEGGTIGGDDDSDGNISNGASTGYGGGVHMAGGSFTMSGGTISHNQSCATSVFGGGAVCLTSDSIFEMSAGIINNNSTSNNGGAVLIGPSAKFEMSGGTISDNKANAGKGVYLSADTSRFILNGSSIDIATSDDIYLPNNAYVTIATNDLMDNIKITLTPESYSEENHVLLADNEADLSLAYDIFAVTPQVSADGSGGTIKWCVTEEGKLARDGVQTYYVDASADTAGASDTGDGSAAKPFATITSALAKIEANAKEDLAYTIVVSGLTSENVGIGATYNTSDRQWEKNDNLKAASITLQGSSESTGTAGNGIGTPEYNMVTPLYVAATNIPVTLTNFTIKYSYADEGAAIYLAENSNVTLSSGTVINGDGSNNSDCNGAIYVSNATLTLKDDASIANWKLGDGAGIYVTGTNSKVYMKGNSSITGCVGSNGGGIYVTGQNSEVYMEENSSITSCTGSSGGGIYVSEGKVYMSDNAVIGGNGTGCTASMWGGGVYVDTAGTFEMDEDATIQYCTISTGGNGGAGVFVKGTFNFMNGKIINNQDSGNSGGGGIYLRDGGKVTMTGGEISNNQSTSNGGGVYFGVQGSACQFDMQGGSISNNTLTDTGTYVNGKGVYVCNSYTDNIKNIFKMSGNAVVASNNDVSLITYGTNPTDEYRAKITIAGALKGTTPVATITPETYGADIQVLELADNAGTTLPAEYSKFDVTPQAITGSTVGTYWRTTETGTIETFTFGTKDSGETKELFDIVFVDGTATPYTADLELTDKQKAGAVAIIFYTGSTSEGDLGVKTLGLGVNQEKISHWAPYGTSGNTMTFEALAVTESATAPEEGTYYWSKDSKYYTGYVNGSDSWSLIQAADSDASEQNYPVFAWANNYDATYSTGVVTENWYIPSVAEFVAMDSNYKTINEILKMLGKTELVTYKTRYSGDDSYWTSNTNNSYTYAWQFELSSSPTSSTRNNQPYYAVAIRQF